MYSPYTKRATSDGISGSIFSCIGVQDDGGGDDLYCFSSDHSLKIVNSGVEFNRLAILKSIRSIVMFKTTKRNKERGKPRVPEENGPHDNNVKQFTQYH